MKIVNVIANHLKSFIPTLTFDKKSSFIPQQQAANNIVLAQKVVYSMKKNRGFVLG